MPIQIQMPRKVFLIIFVAVLILGGFLSVRHYLSLRERLRVAEKTLASQQVNKKVLTFSELFVDNVLQGGQSISFDQRLQLENAVRDINDKEIYTAWQKFTMAKEQGEIQRDFYALFRLLLNKIET